jgi:N-acetylmuramoyl-L-alanine amidase
MTAIRAAVFAALSLAAGAACAGSRIAIDVGHSRAHPGAISAYGVPEFAFNAALAGVVASTLTAAGNDAVLIGADGDIDDLYRRTQIAADADAAFLLSVHHDSAQLDYLQPWQWQGRSYLQSDRFSGFSLFVARGNPYPERSLRCATEIGAALQDSGFRHSAHHADDHAGERRQWADEAHGVYYYDELAVLRTARQPAVLLEAGVIVNRRDALELQRDDVRERIAAAVRAGLARCGVGR